MLANSLKRTRGRRVAIVYSRHNSSHRRYDQWDSHLTSNVIHRTFYVLQLPPTSIGINAASSANQVSLSARAFRFNVHKAINCGSLYHARTRLATDARHVAKSHIPMLTFSVTFSGEGPFTQSRRLAPSKIPGELPIHPKITFSREHLACVHRLASGTPWESFQEGLKNNIESTCVQR